jgi:hypothetical protein
MEYQNLTMTQQRAYTLIDKCNAKDLEDEIPQEKGLSTSI